MVNGEDKAALRNAALGRRDLIPAEKRIQFSLDAASHGDPIFEFDPGTIISGFLPIRSEIDARPLMDRLRSRGARLCLPVILDRTTIAFRELTRGGKLVPTGFGTVGPDQDAELVAPQIMIMPLAAFDEEGNRIGYGAGHYDRAIARLEAEGAVPRRIGLAFSVQRVANIPAESHDRRMNLLIDETGVTFFED